jgi:hypothetical protein
MCPAVAWLDALLKPLGPPVNEALYAWLRPPRLKERLKPPLMPAGPARSELAKALLCPGALKALLTALLNPSGPLRCASLYAPLAGPWFHTEAWALL